MTITTILQNVHSFFEAVFAPVGNTTYANGGLATQLISFISTNQICQIGLIMWVLISVAGVAKRFIPGT